MIDKLLFFHATEIECCYFLSKGTILKLRETLRKKHPNTEFFLVRIFPYVD